MSKRTSEEELVVGIAGPELFPCVQGGLDMAVTAAMIATFIINLVPKASPGTVAAELLGGELVAFRFDNEGDLDDATLTVDMLAAYILAQVPGGAGPLIEDALTGDEVVPCTVDGDPASMSMNMVSDFVVTHTYSPWATLLGALDGTERIGCALAESPPKSLTVDKVASYVLQKRAGTFNVAYNAGGTSTVDLSTGASTTHPQGVEVFYATAAGGATTWAFTNPPAAGSVGGFTLELTNGGTAAQSWPAAVKWDGGVAPTLSAAGVDILEFYTRDAGATWRGFLAAKGSA